MCLAGEAETVPGLCVVLTAMVQIFCTDASIKKNSPMSSIF